MRTIYGWTGSRECGGTHGSAPQAGRLTNRPLSVGTPQSKGPITPVPESPQNP